MPILNFSAIFEAPPIESDHLLEALKVVKAHLYDGGYTRESSAMADVLEICRQPEHFGGLGISEKTILSTDKEGEILFLSSAWLEALNSSDRAISIPEPLHDRPAGRRGMTLSEKIFAMHDTEQKGSVAPGDLIRTHVDWVMASELSWSVSVESQASCTQEGKLT